MLAAGALIASVLAFGAAPAAIAAEQEADAQATWKACLGPAIEDRGFTDVSMDSAHYDAINCLAYYGITSGKTADTYDPGSHITRSQMALFLTNAAAKAGIELDDAMDMGFTDLDSTGANRVAAINTLAANGIMEGRTATTFDPTGLVTRADMAQHLFALLDLALDSVLIDMQPDSVEGNSDGIGKIELNDGVGEDVLDGAGQRVDDYFGDVRRTLPAHIDDIIGAVYELGITAGTNGMIGERGTFEPDKPVTRAQMATFIMAALNHTNLRPAGLTAQQTFSETQVSVRDADFKPVVNERVEVFWANFARDAFDRSGRCIDRFVNDKSPQYQNPSFRPCEIDAGDARTDVDGNAMFQPGSGGGRATVTCAAGTAYAGENSPTYRLDAAGLADPDAEYRLWAWSGGFGDTVNDDTELFEAVPANRQSARTAAVSAILKGGSRYQLRMGSALVYEIQLADRMGRPVGPNPTGNQDFTVTVRKRAYTIAGDGTESAGTTVTVTTVQRMSPDSDGHIRIVVTNPDPVIGSNNPDFDVSVEVRRYEASGVPTNSLRFVDTTGASGSSDAGFDAAGYLIGEASGSGTGPNGDRRYIGAQAPVERFSDNPPAATSISVSPRAAGRVLAGANQNSVSVTVLDQYGNPYRAGASYTATNSGAGDGSQYPGNNNAANSGALTSNSGGRVYFNYNHPVAGVGTETVAITDADAAAAGTATVIWANVPTGASTSVAVALLLADPASRRLFAGDAAAPIALAFGDDDSFMVDGTALSYAQFQEVLTVGVSSDPRISFNVTGGQATTLAWEGFNNNRPNDRASWTLTGLTCTPPPGADAETYDTR